MNLSVSTKTTEQVLKEFTKAYNQSSVNKGKLYRFEPQEEVNHNVQYLMENNRRLSEMVVFLGLKIMQLEKELKDARNSFTDHD